ncbi:hypothetical protein [Serratia sp. (in: enterobacteria)]|uniref:hypothetical protein n=1 Tax=Serratia sp. (in: enterobacteria) TaxID=616 RepID=UPI00398973B2
MKKKMSCISLNYRKVLGAPSPVLSIDFVNIKNEHFTIRYNFPPDTPKRTERRVSILLNLLQRQQKFNFKDLTVETALNAELINLFGNEKNAGLLA